MNIHDEVKELRKLWGSFWQARVLLTANNLRVFDHLKKSRNAAQIAGLINTDARATEILLDAVTGLGLLKKSANRYRNSYLANRLLVTGMPYYQGDILRHAGHLWENWSNLDEIVKTGLPSRKSFEADAFIRGMHNIAVLKAPDVIKAIGLKGVKKALDLGGGPGTYSMEMAKKVKSVTLFDLPETIAIAKDIIGKTGLKNISYIEGDFLTDNIGDGYDLIFISQVLHSFSEANNLKILEKSYNALNPDGIIVIQEFFLEKDRTEPVPGALFSVNMLVNTHGGRSYSAQEIKGWLASLGFKKIRHMNKEENVLVSGRKIA
jgi:2-polyprenyl-3-methyl-5-hydroxy-6-metoxy-1,4-benzoquinol methylase